MDMSTLNQLKGKIIPAIFLALLVVTCQEVPVNKAPVISDLIVYPSQPKAGQVALLTGVVADEDGDPLTLKWMASGGAFLDTLGSNPIHWQAPTNPDTIKFYLEVSDAQETTTETYGFYLEAGIGTVAGHVTDASTGYLLSNVLIDIDGITSTTGEDGYFSFIDIVPGENLPLSAQATNYVTYADLIDVKAEENIVNISLTLLTEVGRIAGYVSDSVSGEKLANVIVQTGTVTDTTGIDGYYELYNVPLSENVPVRAVLGGYSIASSLITVSAGYNTNNIVLVPNIASVSGLVTAAADDASLAGVVVTINQYTDTTNVAGFYQITDIPVISNASVSVVLSGYVTTFSVVDIDGGSNHLDFVLQENPGTLSGWVRNATDGTIVAGVPVRIGQTTTTSDYEGFYQIGGLSTGPAMVICEQDGYTDFSSLVDIQAGENRLDLDLVPNVGNVVGFLRDSLANLSLGDQSVYLGNEMVTTGDDGAFSFESIALGQYSLHAEVSGYQMYSLIVNVVAGTTFQNLLLNPATATVTGVVQDELTARGIGGATITIGNSSTLSDTLGFYELSNIVLGAGQLSCTADGFSTLQAVLDVQLGTNIVNLDLTADHGRLMGFVTDSTTSLVLDSVWVILDGDSVLTGTDGYYEFEDVSTSGQFTLVAQRSGYLELQQWVSVNPGDNSLDLFLQPDN